jgi:hypothetical protein
MDIIEIKKEEDDEQINLIIEPQNKLKLKNIITKNYINKKGETIFKQYNSKIYNDNFREKIKNTPVICDICNSSINYYAMSNHRKSLKCLKAKANQLQII